jgi:endonuclease/exonuclease/phosphatase family metal-dependent hydrolase
VLKVRSCLPALAAAALLACAGGTARTSVLEAPQSAPPPDSVRAAATLRVLSWNVSGDSFVKHPEAFRQHLLAADPDLILLDEAAGTRGPDDLRPLLDGLRGPTDTKWNISWGARGGRQRGVVASRLAVAPIDAFQSNRYRDEDARSVLALVSPGSAAQVRQSIDDGIPVHAAIVTSAGRRLLVVTVDLQCCGETWQEVRRLAEAREIRRLVSEAIVRDRPDAAVIAGDFNVAIPRAGEVIGVVPLLVSSGPYPPPVHGLIAAEAYRRDGTRPWTIDGRETGFPSAPFDFQLYSPSTLSVVDALVLDSEDTGHSVTGVARLKPEWSQQLSEHRAVVVTYRWKDGPQVN